MPTTNPVPSTDPSDLLFNAGKLDEVVNGAANSFTDRLGIARRTVAGMNADFDAQLADAESDLNVYRADAAASAAEALGYLQTIRATSYGAYAEDPETDPLGNPPTEGDEYWNTAAKLLKRWNGTTWQASDINTANLAASSGSSLIGYDGGTAQDVLDGAKSLQDYTALRTYTGRAKRIYITGLLVAKKPAGIAGIFQYDQMDTTSADNGGTVIVGADGRRWKRDFIGAIHVNWFGAVSGNSTVAVANYTAIRAALAACITHDPVRLEGQAELEFGEGEYFITGNSPLMFNRTAMTALPGGYRYRRGLKFKGRGKRSTILTLVTTGAYDQWLYDTYDANYPNDSSVADYIQFDGLTFRGTNALHAQPANSKTSAFNLRTYGWEKFITWSNCDFEYLDTVFSVTGYGNGDHLRWYGCHFSKVRDRVFYFNNNQSVANKLFGCDAESIYGKVIEIGQEGGGDISWFGGSIVLNPDVDSAGFQNAVQTQKGFVYWDNSGKTTGSSSGYGNCKFTFNGLRFETYTSSQPFVYSKRTESTEYGLLEVVFNDCSMVNPADFVTNLTPTTSYVGVELQNAISVKFNRCDLHYVCTYTLSKHSPSLEFNDCKYKNELPITNSNLLSGKCSITGGTGSIKANNCVSNDTLLVAGDYSQTVSINFNKLSQSGSAGTLKVNGKDANRGWPQPNLVGQFKTYFPEGSIVYSALIDKPAETVTSPSLDYGLQIKDSSGNVLLAAVPQNQNLGVLRYGAFSAPVKIPASPNNFLSVSAVGNGTSSLFQDKTGGVFFTYV